MSFVHLRSHCPYGKPPDNLLARVSLAALLYIDRLRPHLTIRSTAIASAPNSLAGGQLLVVIGHIPKTAGRRKASNRLDNQRGEGKHHRSLSKPQIVPDVRPSSPGESPLRFDGSTVRQLTWYVCCD